jgi:hypothetical protein
MVCCLDFHVLFRNGALTHVLEWFGASEARAVTAMPPH